MQHILALSVILLHHVDSYSCRTVANQLQQPLDSDTDVTESLEVEKREREVTGILKQFIAGSSELNSNELLEKTLAKLTIEPYQGRNVTKRKGPLHHDKQKTIAPLAIIVTSLQELTRLKNRNRNNEKKITENEKDETVTSDPEQDVMEHSKEISITDLNTDLRTNKENSSIEDVEADNDSIEKDEDVDVNSHNDDFSVEDDVTNLSKDFSKQDSPYIDVAWLSKEELVPDTAEAEDVFNENIESESTRPNVKNKQFDFNSYTDSIDVKDKEKEKKKKTFREEQPIDAELNTEDQENLINLLLKDIDGTDLKIIEETVNQTSDNITSLSGDSQINLKVSADIDRNNLVASKSEPRLVEGSSRDKCTKKREHNPRNTYHLSFLFNR